MQTELRFLANVREQLGASQEQVVVPEIARAVGDVRRWLAQCGPVWGETPAEGRALRMVVDHQIVSADTTMYGGCEVVPFSPVTGG